MTPRASKHATTDKVLILSQKNLTEGTLSSIKVTVDFGVRMFRSGNQYIIKLRDADYDAGRWPADLRQITDYAVEQGCGWVVLDEFAAPNPDLPQY